MNDNDLDQRIKTIYNDLYIGQSRNLYYCARELGYATGISFSDHCRRLGLRLRTRGQGRSAANQEGQPWHWPEDQPPQRPDPPPAERSGGAPKPRHRPQNVPPPNTTRVPIGNNKWLQPHQKPHPSAQPTQPDPVADLIEAHPNITNLIQSLRASGIPVQVNISIQLNLKE